MESNKKQSIFLISFKLYYEEEWLNSKQMLLNLK